MVVLINIKQPLNCKTNNNNENEKVRLITINQAFLGRQPKFLNFLNFKFLFYFIVKSILFVFPFFWLIFGENGLIGRVKMRKLDKNEVGRKCHDMRKIHTNSSELCAMT